MAFDPQAATARYIDSLGAVNLEKEHDYTVGGHWLLLLTAGEYTVRILPPLVATKEELARGLHILEEVL